MSDLYAAAHTGETARGRFRCAQVSCVWHAAPRLARPVAQWTLDGRRMMTGVRYRGRRVDWCRAKNWTTRRLMTPMGMSARTHRPPVHRRADSAADRARGGARTGCDAQGESASIGPMVHVESADESMGPVTGGVDGVAQTRDSRAPPWPPARVQNPVTHYDGSLHPSSPSDPFPPLTQNAHDITKPFTQEKRSAL